MSSMLRDAELRARMRTPSVVFVLLIVLLGGVSAVGVLAPRWWPLEFSLAASMVVLILVFSMEMMKHQPMVRFFSLVGFFWVAILFGLTMVDYLTR